MIYTKLRNENSHIINRLKFDQIIAILGLSFSLIRIIILLSQGDYEIQMYSALLIFCLIYLIYRKKLLKNEVFTDFQFSNRMRIVFHIIFIISFCISIIIALTNLYNYRSIFYFLSILIAAGSIIIEILWINEKQKSSTVIILIKIILLSLSVYAIIYFAFPGIYGGDTWEHNYTIEQLVASGNVPKFENIGPFDNYYNFPIFHIFSGVTQMITSLNTTFAIFFSIGLSNIFLYVFVFLIGRKIFNVKVGLLATLIVSLCNWNIERAVEIIPNTLAFCYFLVIIYLIFANDKRDIRYILLLILLSICLIFTHTIGSLITLIAIASIFFGIKLFNKFSKLDAFSSFKGITFSYIVLFAVMMFSLWIINRPIQSGSLFQEWLLMFKSSLESQTGLVSTSFNLSISDYFIRFLDSGAFFFFLLGFAIFGSLIFFQRKNRSIEGFGLMMSAAILFVVVYIFQLFNLKNIVPERWFPFMYVFMIIMAMFGLLNISSILKKKWTKIITTIIPILIVIFMMITSTAGNADSPLIFNGAQRMGKTSSELISVKALWEIGCGCPTTDLRYGITIPYIIGVDNYTELLSRGNKIFISRIYYLYNPEWNERYSDKITDAYVWHSKADNYVLSDYAKRLGIDSKSLIYDNGNVTAYLLNQ